MTQIQKMAKAIENIKDGERLIRITDYQNMDTIEVKRKDIKSFSYPALDNKVVYIFALADIEEAVRQHFLNDIAENRGYDRSQSQWCLLHNSYYKRKRKAIFEIARGLLLI